MRPRFRDRPQRGGDPERDGIGGASPLVSSAALGLTCSAMDVVWVALLRVAELRSESASLRLSFHFEWTVQGGAGMDRWLVQLRAAARRLGMRALVCSMLGACAISSYGLSQGSECELTSDCDAPLVCRIGRCRRECATSRDCAAGPSTASRTT